MKSLFLALFLLVPTTAFATGHCNVQRVQKVQQFNQSYSQNVQAVQAYAIPVLAAHQNFIQQNVQYQQQKNVEYVAAAPVKQKIIVKEKVQRQVVRERRLRERVKNVRVEKVQNVDYSQNVQQNNAY
jgi:hypothetical protein